MHGKKNLMLWAALFALALPLLIAGTASAMYMDDGARPDGNGGWTTPSDMVCIKGLHADGTLDIVAGVTNSRDCIYYNTGLTGMTMADVTATHAAVVKAPVTYGACKLAKSSYVWDFVNSRCLDVTACSGTDATTKGTLTWNAGDSKCYDAAACMVAGATGNDGAKHALATSICVDGSGNGISLKDMDRTFAMCTAKGGTWKQTSDTIVTNGTDTLTVNSVQVSATPGFGGACIAYGRQFMGQNASGTPSAFGAKGTAAGTDGQGYCYTTLNLTTAYTTQAACPSNSTNASTAYDWAWGSSKCTYAKGIKGYLNGALTKPDGTTTAAGTYVDLSLVTTMGDCIAAGASWNNWVGVAGSTTSIPTTPLASTIPAWNYTTQAPDADTGCLHCHSNVTQYNGPAERWKDSYLKTGHKNMLRKVTAGIKWAGPDGVVYTQDTAGHAIDFTAGTVGGGPLYYVFGDWMAAVPDAVGPNGDTPTYSCAACHTAGYKDNTNPGAQAMGTPGYTPAQPGAPASGSVTAGNKWDLEGIQCARCHNAAVPTVTAAMISANTATFTTTAPLSGGMGALAAGTGRTNLCFGCHQSIAKTWPAGASQYDPTLIPTGVSHGAAAGRDFNGHVLGNSFLNSPHSRYTGTIKLNSLGKFDLSDPNGTTEYSSLFKGFTCWQSPITNSPAKTKADGTEIKTKSECETIYGAGSWRADATGDLGTLQGSCSTCHDVHNSMFVASQEEAALRKTCADCHANNATTGATDASLPQITTISHPVTHGAVSVSTPFDATAYPEGPCVVCHMATQAVANGDQNTLAAHLWRINVDPNYNTFPTTAQFYGGSCSVHTGAVQNAPSSPVVYLSDTTSAACTAAAGTWTAATKDRNAQVAADGSYTNAVWVDLTMACGQCHGDKGSAHLMSKAGIGPFASVMHDGGAVPTTNCATCHASAQNGKVAIKGGFGPGKNHHGAVPGESAECIECHARPGTLPDGWNTGGAMGVGAGTAFCLPCHTNYPTPGALVPGVSHHAGACVTCHIPNDTTGTVAVTGPGVIPVNVVGGCTKCHPSKTMANLQHPTTSATPATCQTCHNAGGFIPNVATSHTCDQCHGGGTVQTSPTGTLIASAPWISTAGLVNAAAAIHTVSNPTSVAPVVGHGAVTLTGWTVSFTDTSTDADGTTDPVTVNWGDGVVSTGVAGGTFTHDYSRIWTKDVNGNFVDSGANPNPRPRSYSITHVVTDFVKASLISRESIKVNVPQRFTVSGIVTAADGTTPLPGSTIALKLNGHTVNFAKGSSFNFTNVLPGGPYTIKVYKFKYTFSDVTIPTLSTNVSVTISAH